jgi:methylmalonyl-CoA/ethylmalonyl-CoA epimerase
MDPSPPRPEFPGGELTVSTVGMAVPDIRAAMDHYWRVLGWGPWRVYRQEPPALRDMRYCGEPAEFSFLVAGTTISTGAAFWLCQPLEGPSLYRDLVESGEPGPHFMTVWREREDDSATLCKRLVDLGASELMSARLDAIEFAFFDARDLCGMILETGSGRSTAQPLHSTYP